MHESEWKTRKTRIDRQLQALNPAWEIIPYTPALNTSELSCHAVEEYPTLNGPADYALFVNGNLLGILEAKKVAVDPWNVLEQAKRYAAGCPNHHRPMGRLQCAVSACFKRYKNLVRRCPR